MPPFEGRNLRVWRTLLTDGTAAVAMLSIWLNPTLDGKGDKTF
jgi:hypothetical protein